jgi:uroporphyrinogen decarboxylase
VAMDRAERIRAVLAGEKPDRYPYSFWTHLASVDHDPYALADETLRFYREYGLDFVKTMPNGMFSVEDFGCECDFSQVPLGGIARITKYAVYEPDDWLRLKRPDIRAGALRRELLSLRLVVQGTGGEAPVLATVFSPLTTAYKLSGDKLFEHIKVAPDRVRRGLETIARSTAEYAGEALKLGCAGLFFAEQLATSRYMSEADYLKFGLPYASTVLESLGKEAWFNIAHFHGTQVHHGIFAHFPVKCINWHMEETAPSLSDFFAESPGKVAVGGLNRTRITEGDTAAFDSELREVADSLGGSPMLFATGCAIRYPVRRDILLSVANSVRRLEVR